MRLYERLGLREPLFSSKREGLLGARGSDISNCVLRLSLTRNRQRRDHTPVPRMPGATPTTLLTAPPASTWPPSGLNPPPRPTPNRTSHAESRERSPVATNSTHRAPSSP